MNINVPVYAWHGDSTLSMNFPETWDVTEQRMAGHDAPALTEDQIRAKLAQPIGSKPLHELAKDKEECVILVDDLTRPTKASEIIPQVLKELHKAGIQDDHIRFVLALGAHHWMRLDDIRKKLGNEIPDRYNVYNHNVYENNVFVGKTSYGTPVYLNKEVMRCDLKISVGCMIPHRAYGYGGGSKILIPGVASIETISTNHARKTPGVGVVEENIRRLDSEEVVSMAGLDFIVNALVNSSRDCCDLVCGHPVLAHRSGVKLARRHYLTETTEADVVVVNGYPMETEAYKVLDIAKRSIKTGGDTIVLIHTPEGLRGHYYNGRFGTDYGGKGWTPARYLQDAGFTGSTYVVAPHSSLSEQQYFGLGSKWVKKLDDALEHLMAKYGKSKVRAAVYPYAPIQITKHDLPSKSNQSN